jgi:hexosaminidase
VSEITPLLLPMPRHVALDDKTVTSMSESEGTDASIPPEGYRITISRRRLKVEASDRVGVTNAGRTLTQLREVYGTSLPTGVIDDWPDLAVRGVMLDVSRDKVPKIETLFWLIDRLSSWKINQVQLYTEHTFAYADHEEVWEHASPYTADEMKTLDTFCARRHVELVPNQNCLGHMERWLSHDRYRPLALRPGGFDFMGDHRGPSTLDPTDPGALELVRGLLGELLPNFASRRVNVGLDEPWELGADRRDDYLAWVRALRAAPELDGHEMVMWGDILSDVEAIEALPDGVTVCDWGYDDTYPFDERARLFAAAGRRFWLSPGTSSWLSLVGRLTNAKTTIANATEAAIRHGGVGIVNTDWGDMGHLQYLPISEPPLAYGAAVSWCLDANRDLDLAGALDRYCYADDAGVLGKTLLALGDLHRVLSAQMPNMSLLAAPLYVPQLHLGRGPAQGVTAEEYHDAERVLRVCRDQLGRVRPRREDGPLVVNELENSIDLLLVLCADARGRLTEGAADGSVTSLSPETRQQLAARLGPIIERHRRLWAARNRNGGLDDSCARLLRLRQIYETGSTEGLAFYG